MTLNSYSLEPFAQDPTKGVGKQNRLKQIESYLTQFSKDYGENVTKKFSAIEKRLTTLENKKSFNDMDAVLKKIREEIAQVRRTLSQEHTQDMIDIKDEIEKLKKDSQGKREAQFKALLNRIMVLEKTISGFSKIKSI